MQVTTKTKDGSALTVEYEFGASLRESVAKFGEEIVWSHFVRNGKIAVQSLVSRLMKAGKPKAEIEKAVAAFKLEGKRRQGKSKAEKAEALLAGMTEQEKADFLRRVKAAKG